MKSSTDTLRVQREQRSYARGVSLLAGAKAAKDVQLALVEPEKYRKLHAERLACRGIVPQSLVEHTTLVDVALVDSLIEARRAVECDARALPEEALYELLLLAPGLPASGFELTDELAVPDIARAVASALQRREPVKVLLRFLRPSDAFVYLVVPADHLAELMNEMGSRLTDDLGVVERRPARSLPSKPSGAAPKKTTDARGEGTWREVLAELGCADATELLRRALVDKLIRVRVFRMLSKFPPKEQARAHALLNMFNSKSDSSAPPLAKAQAIALLTAQPSHHALAARELALLEGSAPPESTPLALRKAIVQAIRFPVHPEMGRSFLEHLGEREKRFLLAHVRIGLRAKNRELLLAAVDATAIVGGLEETGVLSALSKGHDLLIGQHASRAISFLRSLPHASQK